MLSESRQSCRDISWAAPPNHAFLALLHLLCRILPMSLTGRLRWILSPEGPFAFPAGRRWRQFVADFAKLLCVDLYEWSKEERFLAASYIALHKSECLFLYFRVFAEFDARCRDSHQRDVLADYTFVRLYGKAAPRLIARAVEAFADQDAEAPAIAKQRCIALAAASCGDTTQLRSLPEFDQGLRRGLELFNRADADLSVEEEAVLAYQGLHALWLADIMNTQAFGDWLVLQRSQAALDSVLQRLLGRSLDAKRSSDRH